MAQAYLTGTGIAHFDVFVAQNVGTTGFMKANCLCHVESPILYSICNLRNALRLRRRRGVCFTRPPRGAM
jgi:hypothetical protein